MALFSRFNTTCSMRTASAFTNKNSSALNKEIDTERDAGSALAASTMDFTRSFKQMSERLTVNLPVFKRDISSKSSIIFAWLTTELRITSIDLDIGGEACTAGMRDNSSTLI